MTTFYLLRHGENDKDPGDQPLNETGRRQATITAQFFARLPVDAVYASPLARARQTAQCVADLVGLSVVVDERLRERANFGDLPGQTLAEFVAMWQRCDGNRDHAPEVGLAARANGERLEAWLRAVHAEMPGGTIGDFLLNIFPRPELARQLPGFPHSIANCSITVVHFDGDRFTLERLAAVDHLESRTPHTQRH